MVLDIRRENEEKAMGPDVDLTRMSSIQFGGTVSTGENAVEGA